MKRHASRARVALAAGALLACAAISLHGETGNSTLGLPPVALPSSDVDAAVALGRKLFFDARLSRSGNVSCATCHDPSRALTDGLRVSAGESRLEGSRNAPSLINVRFNDTLFWEGRRNTLEEQALDPFFNPVEHALTDAADLLGRIKGDGEYARFFRQAYGIAVADIDAGHVARALGAFQRTMVAGDTPFDRYYYGGDKSALDERALRGLKLFQGMGQCAKCHTISEKDALFTDQKFHRLSVGAERIEGRLAELTREVVARRGRGESLDRLVQNADIAELGRFVVTLNPADIGKFRTPPLRNVALTAPYMHDGSVKTLEEAVELEIYYRGAERGYPLVLSLEERDDLVAFMRALTSPHANRWAR